MAGGNVSPRQKMINMMYLVLLALLAMNVSAEILDAFETIRLKLQGSANTALVNSEGFIKSMKAEIDKEKEDQGLTRNLGLKDTLDQIKDETSAIIGEIDRHSDSLLEIAGVDPETGKIIGKGETEKNFQYFMGTGKAVEKNDGRGEGAARRCAGSRRRRCHRAAKQNQRLLCLLGQPC